MGANFSVSDRHTLEQEAFLPLIRELSARLRQELEAAWSADTAHHSVRWDSKKASTGQCYVSSMALVRRLLALAPKVDARIARGALLHDGKVLIADHGWVVITTGDGRILVDLTIDQAGLKLRELVAPQIGVEALGLTYAPIDLRQIDEVTSSDALGRYILLEARLSPLTEVQDWLNAWQQPENLAWT